MLGLAGFALSYDALRQMAVAVHVRGALSFLFPLLIDGFIAYGIRALLVLRTAPPAARVYVWALFGSATGASIWANALHAVRINQQTDPDDPGLRLGDTTVGVLSTLAPLALAGAVHLYTLIARQPAPTTAATDRRTTAGHPSRTGDPVTDRVPTATVTPDTRRTELPLAGGRGDRGHRRAGAPPGRGRPAVAGSPRRRGQRPDHPGNRGQRPARPGPARLQRTPHRPDADPARRGQRRHEDARRHLITRHRPSPARLFRAGDLFPSLESEP